MNNTEGNNKDGQSGEKAFSFSIARFWKTARSDEISINILNTFFQDHVQ